MASAAAKPELEVHPFASQAQWERWLRTHHATSNGLWLQLAKKDSGIASVTYAEGVESALCYGWIDGHKRALDAQYWVQKFTPRTARSRWSEINRAKALKLIADGRWDAAYASPRNATVPEDLAAALAEDSAAQAFFAGLRSANRYAILYRVQEAKRPETRARRIEEFVAMLAAGKTLH